MRNLHSIWPRGRTLEVPVPLKLRVEGWVEVELIDAKTGLIKRHLRFRNLITDAGLNAYYAGSTMSQMTTWAACGTSSTPPANGDTALIAEVTPSTTHRTNQNGGIADVIAHVGASFYWSFKRTFRFLEAQANGNLTEFGLFSAQSAGTMWTRQLFKDGGGTPTTIVKTSSDQLRITYELRVHYPSADIVSTKNISGTVYDYTVRPNDVDNAGGGWQLHQNSGHGGNWLGSAGGFGACNVFESNTLVATTANFPSSGSGFDQSSQSYASYVAGSFVREGTTIWEPDTGNFATGVGGLTVGHGGFQNQTRLFQVVFHTTKLPKTNTKRLTLVWSWALTRFP
jgi:hypothetical protein